MGNSVALVAKWILRRIALTSLLLATGCQNNYLSGVDHMEETPVRIVSESQLKDCLGKRVLINGTVVADAKSAAYISSDVLPSGAMSIEQNWEWPRELHRKRVQVIGELAWSEPYVVPSDPEDGMLRARQYEPGQRVEGHYYLKCIEYKIIP